jgi:hypothetical protein
MFTRLALMMTSCPKMMPGGVAIKNAIASTILCILSLLQTVDAPASDEVTVGEASSKTRFAAMSSDVMPIT